ncbi:MAG: PKD domain-containing protein [Nitrospiraceae bacterium]
MHDRKPFGSLLWAVLLVVAVTFGFNGCGNVNDVAVPNNAPVANAGPDLGSLISGTVITLNGSASTDPNGDPLTYSWSFTSKPAGGAAVLANPTSVTPTFTVDLAGDYVVRLIVNDGASNSAPDTAIFSTNNVAPVANAGPDQGGIAPGSLVTLDGSASTDGDGDQLTYSWSLTSKPAGSAAVLANPTSVTPTFTADLAGDYTAQLIVNDGTVDSAPDSVIITSKNVAPVANAGPDQDGKALESLVTLDGSASSDANGDPLTYSWSLTAKPDGSAAVLANPTSVAPTFTVDRAGTYVVQLIVNDGTLSSAPNTVNISTVNVAPVANAGPDQGGKSLGSLVTLNGSASSDANVDPLTYSWSLTAKPAGSAAVLTNPTSVTPSFTVDLHGTYTAQLIVNDGTVSSAPNTVNISTVSVTPLTITTNSLPEGRRNRSYAATLKASGGTIPYTWSEIVIPDLPAGLTLDSATGLISGTPTAKSDRRHDFTVQDSTGQTTTKNNLRLRIRDDDDD